MSEAFPFTLGHMNAMRISAIRTKFGCFPVPKGKKPLKGMKNFPVPEPYDFGKMTTIQRESFPLNRADYRKRIRPHLPRNMRLDTWTRRRRPSADSNGPE